MNRIEKTAFFLGCTVSLFGCTTQGFLDVGNSLSSSLIAPQYGTGGTKLPEHPEYFFLTGVSVTNDVTKKFGPPQIFQVDGDRTTMTYSYWENNIGQASYEETYVFAFNGNGFLQNVIKTEISPTTTNENSTKIKGDQECPNRFSVCKSYKH